VRASHHDRSTGLTGAWAEENTRESIFAAFKRKETFGTSGNRIQVRLFGSWNYPADLTKQSNWIKAAYYGGVPMGSDLPAAPSGAKGPSFAVYALKDPRVGNLDRIQIIRVWTKNGHSHEKVFDVAWSGDRKPDPKTGKVPAVGNTVDLKTATYTNTIGATELSGVWTDPEFDSQSYVGTPPEDSQASAVSTRYYSRWNHTCSYDGTTHVPMWNHTEKCVDALTCNHVDASIHVVG
jgi:hypothetical protein